MIPDLETMTSDIVKWIGRSDVFEIWFEPDSQSYNVRVWSNVFHDYNLEKCISKAWAYVDKYRE